MKKATVSRFFPAAGNIQRPPQQPRRSGLFLARISRIERSQHFGHTALGSLLPSINGVLNLNPHLTHIQFSAIFLHPSVRVIASLQQQLASLQYMKHTSDGEAR